MLCSRIGIFAVYLLQQTNRKMILNGKEVAFPAVMQVCFSKIIDTLEEQAEDKDQASASYARELLKEVEKSPELKTGIDLKSLDKYEESIKKIAKPLFPTALKSNEIKALTPPFFFEPILTSTQACAPPFGNFWIRPCSGTIQFQMN